MAILKAWKKHDTDKIIGNKYLVHVTYSSLVPDPSGVGYITQTEAYPDDTLTVLEGIDSYDYTLRFTNDALLVLKSSKPEEFFNSQVSGSLTNKSFTMTHGLGDGMGGSMTYEGECIKKIGVALE